MPDLVSAVPLPPDDYAYPVFSFADASDTARPTMPAIVAVLLAAPGAVVFHCHSGIVERCQGASPS
jgi:hypothetical protein